MLDVFLNAVLPVFSVAALGFAFRRTGVFDGAGAMAINRFVFNAALPVLLFRLIATAPVERFEWPLVAAYAIAEVALYAAGFAVARFLFHRPWTECLLLGMASGFANHVFFVLPISQTVYGDAGLVPVTAVIVLDSVVMFGGAIAILETAGEAAHGLSPARLLLRFSRNPPILAIAAGVVTKLASLRLADGVDNFSAFLGATAAPCSLFALGVVLGTGAIRAGLGRSIAFAALKLAAMPLIAWALFSTILPVSPEWLGPAMLLTAGPTGAMPFVLGLQYKASVEIIAPTILLTTLGSLLTVTLATQLS